MAKRKKKKKKDRVEAVVEQVEGEIVEPTEETTKEQNELERITQELEEAKAQAAEYLDGWQRTQAEFSNYKKRQEAGRVQMTALSNAALLRKLLPAVDDFERAMATCPTDTDQATWFEGISLIQQKLDALVESEGVKAVETEGQAFDPRYHEAVTYEEAEGFQEGQIIAEVQGGYTLGERVLRPALVRVAKAPAPVPQPEAEAAESDNEQATEQDQNNDTTKVKE